MRRTKTREREARDRIEKGGGEAEKRQNPQERCRCYAESGGDLGGRREKRRQENISSVDFDPEHPIEKNKQAGREAQGTRVPTLSCLIRGFHNMYH